jgi:Flp pilus assembly protein TadG
MRAITGTSRNVGGDKRLAWLLRDQRGGSLVEYALVTTMFTAIIMGMLGFGQALYTYHFVSHAAREGARYAAVRGNTCGSDNSCTANNSATGITGPTDNADVTAFVRNMAPPGINSTGVTVNTCGTAGDAACANDTQQFCTAAFGTYAAAPNWPGCVVQVQVQYTYNFIVPLVYNKAVKMTSSSDLIIVH